MRILLTGSKGQVGQSLKDRLPEDWELIAADSKTLDITDSHNVANMVKTFEPDIIVNTAGYTQIDKAESHAELAFAVNATGVLNLARAAKTQGARLIHLSTDQVFDGSLRRPMDESCAPNPLNVYGKSKLAGEVLALNAHIDTLIVRTSWLYSEYGHNFVKSILRLAREKDVLPIASDQIGNPTYAGDLADVLIHFAQDRNLARGIYHYTGTQQTTWSDFAAEILRTAAAVDAHYANVRVEPIPTAQYEAPAARPLYCVLDSRQTQKLLPDLRETPLAEVVQKVLAQ